ncbi:MAG: glutathione S-transferase [Rhodobacteraceae bacterium]|nr:glutathione S-transferase [Paracoccaceae bacterium]
MTYDLILGDRAYSSWSLRGWLLFHRFAIPADTSHVSLNDGSLQRRLAGFPPARTVPTLITPEGAVVHDSMAIAEELATRHSDAGIWPSDPGARAWARTLAAEMHSGFTAMRRENPMNLRCAYSSYDPPENVRADLRRAGDIWGHALERSGGPWLCGDYSAADAFFAPLAARIAGYGMRVSGAAETYVAAHLADPAFRRWRAMSLVSGPDLPQYARDFDQTAWPGPAPLPARAVEAGPSENHTCPYSGKPVTHFLELETRVFGFCNAFCRDKTVADPQAWPKFTALL